MIRTLAAALATSTCIVALATPAAAQTREYNIPAGSLKSALDAYVRQSGRQVVYRADEVRSARSPGARGPLSAEAALTELLAGSGFTTRVDGNLVAIVKAGNGDTAKSVTTSAEEGDSASQEIIVTGTNIRGVVNQTQAVRSLGTRYLDDTGYATAEEVVDSIPQNFGGGQEGFSEDGIFGTGASVATNFTYGSAINLRGLGNLSTLTLVNGHRLAASGFGQAVDISQLPLALIERIDVLADGSSAIYGADAVAGVVNFVLKSDYSGAETRLRTGFAEGGGRSEFLGSQLVGANWATGNVTVSGQYQWQSPLYAEDRREASGVRLPTDLLPKTESYGGSVTIRQDLLAGVRFRGNVFYSHKDLFRTLTTLAGRKTENSPTSELLTYGGGLTIKLGGSWTLEPYAQHSQQHLSNYTVQTNLNAAPRNGDQFTRLNQDTADLTLRGNLFSWGTKDVSIAIGGSYRGEHFHQLARAIGLTSPNIDRGTDRKVYSSFAEVYVPLVNEDDGISFIRAFDISAAARIDDYSDFGSVTSPRIGVRWAPVDGLNIRGAYSEAFRAPSPSELFNSDVSANLLIDRATAPSGTGLVPFYLLTGGNDQLRPERARTISLGVDYSPEWISGAKFSASYYNVRYRDRIVIPSVGVGVLTQRAAFGALVSDLSNDAAAVAYLNAARANGVNVFDLTPGATGATGVRYIVDGRIQNAQLVKQSGIDFAASYSNGPFSLDVDASFILGIDTSYVVGTSTDLVDTFGNPVDFRLRTQASWHGAWWNLSGAVNYVDSYTNSQLTTEPKIGSWTTVDLRAGIDLSEVTSDRFGKGFQVSFAVSNILNQRAPFVTPFASLYPVSYDPTNASPIGRTFSLELRKTW